VLSGTDLKSRYLRYAARSTKLNLSGRNIADTLSHGPLEAGDHLQVLNSEFGLKMESLSSPKRLLVRCFAEPIDGHQWQAFSLEFGLAAQGDSFPEVRHKLEAMLRSYLYDALVGDDREHAEELLTRKATWRVYTRYHLTRLAHALPSSGSERPKRAMTFSEPMAFTPTLCT
jgi:hypothetical protein